MTRDEIYDHLAQVYIGKKKKADAESRRQLNAWLVINILITVLIFASAFYGLTAFLRHKRAELKSNVIFLLNKGPVKLSYNFNGSFPPVESFSLTVPPIDAGKYKSIRFSVRAKEEGNPGILKIVLKNKRNETASYYIRDIKMSWKEYVIPLEEFKQITDFSSLTELSFVLESWNVQKDKGIIMIEDIAFSS